MKHLTVRLCLVSKSTYIAGIDFVYTKSDMMYPSVNHVAPRRSEIAFLAAELHFLDERLRKMYLHAAQEFFSIFLIGESPYLHVVAG